MPEPAAAGTLRLSRRLLLALAALSGDDAESVGDRELEALQAAGVVVGGVVHPELVVVAEAVRSPVVSLIVERLAPPPAVRGEGWCSPKVAVLGIPQPQSDDEVMAVPVGEVVVQLAALVGLGPRPPAVAEVGPPARPRLHWRVEARWHGPGGAPEARTVAALDGGEDGWWLVGDGETDPRPVTATELFRRLCTLLPDDAELG